MDLRDAMIVSGSGMEAQASRLRIIAQNLANADSVSTVPGGDSYRRKTITFANVLDRELGVEKVVVSQYGTDKSPFNLKYDPGHPAAGTDGYVKYPNVSAIIETVDLKEAERGYEANLNSISVTRQMVQQTLQLIK